MYEILKTRFCRKVVIFPENFGSNSRCRPTVQYGETVETKAHIYHGWISKMNVNTAQKLT